MTMTMACSGIVETGIATEETVTNVEVIRGGSVVVAAEEVAGEAVAVTSIGVIDIRSSLRWKLQINTLR